MSTKGFLHYFPTPQFLEMPYVGIDISPYAVRMLEVVNGKQGYVIGRYAEKLFQTPLDFNDKLSTNSELQAILKNLQKEHKLQFIKATLPEEKSYLYKTEVPRGTPNEIRQAIEFHLEENVPISLEEAVFDYHVIDPESKSEMLNVTVSVVSKEVMDDFIKLLDDASLTPVSFLIEAQAICRALIKKEDKGTYLIVNIGKLKTGLFIISEGSVWFSSTLNIGSNDFTNAIMKQFNVGSDEAQKIKHERGFVKNDDNNELLSLLINTASALKDEIGRLYAYWQSRGERQNETRPRIDKIILCGRDSSINGFQEYLASNIQAKVEMANVLANLFSFEDYIPDISFTDSLNYGAATGLALPKEL